MKEYLSSTVFFHFDRPQKENKRKRMEKQVLGSRQITKNVVEHVDDGDTSCNWCTWNVPKKFGKKTGRFGNQRKIQDHPNCCIDKTG